MNRYGIALGKKLAPGVMEPVEDTLPKIRVLIVGSHGSGKTTYLIQDLIRSESVVKGHSFFHSQNAACARHAEEILRNSTRNPNINVEFAQGDFNGRYRAKNYSAVYVDDADSNRRGFLPLLSECSENRCPKIIIACDELHLNQALHYHLGYTPYSTRELNSLDVFNHMGDSWTIRRLPQPHTQINMQFRNQEDYIRNSFMGSMMNIRNI